MSDNPRTVGERIEVLRILLMTGTPSQQSVARRALKDLSRTTRNQKDIQAALAALAGQTPEATKDSLGNERHPESTPESKIQTQESGIQTQPESTQFPACESLRRKMAGLEGPARWPTLLDKAEAGDPEALASLKKYYFWEDPELTEQQEEFEADNRAYLNRDRPKDACIFTPEELERVRLILGDSKYKSRPMLLRVRDRVWRMTSQTCYTDIIRRLDAVRTREDIVALRELEKKILQTDSLDLLRNLLCEFFGQPVQIDPPQTNPPQEVRHTRASKEW